MKKDELLAPEGKVWICGACAKMSNHKYGDDGGADFGWDVSCMMNAVLMDEKEAKKAQDDYYKRVYGKK